MKQDYKNPEPLPEDLFRIYDVNVIDHGYFMAGTKGTGQFNNFQSAVGWSQA